VTLLKHHGFLSGMKYLLKVKGNGMHMHFDTGP